MSPHGTRTGPGLLDYQLLPESAHRVLLGDMVYIQIRTGTKEVCYAPIL